jgi:t-SNARE complex subunit (syntaxin)
MKEEVKELSKVINDIVQLINDITQVIKEVDRDKAIAYTNNLQALLLRYIDIANKLKEDGYVVK